MLDKYQIHTSKIRELTRNIMRDERFKNVKNVYGIPKGGVPFAVTIANFAHLPLALKVKDITNETLVVDDIVDSGETLLKFNQLREKDGVKPIYGVIISKINDINTAARKLLTFQGYEIEEGDWVVFPWEDDENVSKKLDETEIE